MKLIVCFLFAILLMIGCRTTHKTSQSFKSTSDSTHVSASETVAVNKFDSTGTKTTTRQYEKHTVYLYDTIYQVIKGDTVIRYVPRKKEVFENGTYTTDETAAKKGSDSSAAKKNDSIGASKTVQKATTSKDTSSIPLGVIIGGIIALVLVLAAVILATKKPTINI